MGSTLSRKCRRENYLLASVGAVGALYFLPGWGSPCLPHNTGQGPASGLGGPQKQAGQPHLPCSLTHRCAQDPWGPRVKQVGPFEWRGSESLAICSCGAHGLSGKAGTGAASASPAGPCCREGQGRGGGTHKVAVGVGGSPWQGGALQGSGPGPAVRDAFPSPLSACARTPPRPQPQGPQTWRVAPRLPRWLADKCPAGRPCVWPEEPEPRRPPSLP